MYISVVILLVLTVLLTLGATLFFFWNCYALLKTWFVKHARKTQPRQPWTEPANMQRRF